MILRNKKLIGIISAFITANMLLVGCGSAESSSMVDDRDEKIVYANYRDIRDLNPHLYNGEMFAQNLLYESLVKVEDECEKGIKSEFNVGDKVVAKDYPSIVKEVGIIVGIDPREECFGKYLVKFDSLDGDNGWAYGVFINNSYYNIEPYEGRAIWLDDLEKVEEECEEEKCEEGEVYMNEFNISEFELKKRHANLE